MLIQWPKKKVITPEYDYVLLLLVALAPQSTYQDLVSPMTSHICIAFPNIRKPCSSKPTLASDFLLHAIPLRAPARHSHAHQHTNLSLFLTVLSNACPSTPILGHKAVPPIFLLQV